MGYVTDYSLELRYFDAADLEAIRLTEMRYGTIAELEAHGFNAKWYDHEEDMKAISARFPTAVFVLDGFGEEHGDIWRKYFCNGKMQYSKGEIHFENYNPTKLK